MMVRRQPGWMTARVGDELVMMSVDKGNYVGLSDIGRRIWEIVEVPQALDEVCAQLEKEFVVAPDVCRREVEAFLAVLTKHGAIALDPEREP